ncbi:unnamed protein product [Bursaphelenchus xylophilus]|uniref:(pine wood nematode) hypothetical protein n=1 Tax=Bursaphelenchus xylophilus TaxID=6326 RepID=A0A1I7S2W5_BURXY|nr:unnamed protein product [Bursaphelenchus xylophilus]CAG9116008.1 unnamed protein product [Bursaphelenchus xylophilus]
MAHMYRIPPLLQDLEIKPTVPMYKIESIHGASQVQVNSSATKSVSDPVKDLERKQLDLIKNLVEFKKTLDEYLASGVSYLTIADEENTKAGGKADKKAAKKEARAANKVVAKEKKEPAPKSTSLLTLSHPPNSTFNVKADPANPHVKIHDYRNQISKNFEGILECQVVDIKWLSSLIKLGRLRGIHIGPKANGKGSIHFKTTKGTVKLSGLTPAPIVGRVSVWKSLGLLLQVYDPLDGVSALETHEWLVLADTFLNDKISFDQFYRPVNRRLSEIDYLASRSSVLLPDLLLKDLVGTHTVASNTELWINRVSKAV